MCRMSPNIHSRVFSPVIVNSVRFKYQNRGGDGGDRSGQRKQPWKASTYDEDDVGDLGEHERGEHDLLDDKDYDTLANTAMHVVTYKILNEQSVLLIQPYIKWGPRKSAVNPQLQLEEAESLVRTLPNWKVEISMKVSVENMEKKTLFGSGKMEEICALIKQCRHEGRKLSCVFVSKGTLSFVQKSTLEEQFQLPVMDRYSMVIQIFRLHAKTTEAKLQVALAEIPYIWAQMRDVEMLTEAGLKKQRFFLTDEQKMMLKRREKKIQNELTDLRARRELLRNNRRQKQFPVIAVVGYTNAGKTSLIKALTDEASLQPRNQLFATLDVTAHAGRLPCRLEVLYMDTVGFMSDLPTGLLECFVATLEDALEADLIIHVQDVSHKNWLEQRNHVETTLAALIRNNTKQTDHIMENVINIGNKIDMVPEAERKFKELQTISSTTMAGLNDLLLEVEQKLLTSTDRMPMTMRVPNGGEEMQWLYKNAAVSDSEADEEDSQMLLLHVVISKAKFQQFKHRFVNGRK